MNKGNIWQRGKPGSKTWQIQYYVDGKRQYETFHGSQPAAQKRLNQLLVDIEKGTVALTNKITVTQHLDNWYNGYIKTSCGAWQIDGVNRIINKHLKPALGNTPLQKLTPQAIQEYYGHALEKLSPMTVRKHHRLLKQSLKYAVRLNYLGRNPCDQVTPPRPTKKQMRTLTPDEVERLLDVAKDDYFYPIYYFAVSTGLRQAEILGLRWRDIDLDMLSISVNRVLFKRKGVTEFKEPKTAHSRRHVAMTPKLVSFMRDYKSESESLHIHCGHILQLDDLVFTSVIMQPLHASVLSHSFHKLVAKADLLGVRFHDLRHTFASLMLLRGVNVKVISEALGHASTSFTMDVYSHIIKGMQSDAMDFLNDILPKGNMQINHYNITTKLDNILVIIQ